MEFTQEQRWALRKFEELRQKAGSQNKACELVGVSAAILVELKKGTYLGNVEAQFGKLISYFKTKEEAAETYSETDYAPTHISEKVYDLIRNCQIKGGLAIACGDAGIGKTKASKKFAADHPNDAIYIALNPCLTTLKATLKLLSHKLNVTERTNDEMWLGILAKLRDGMIIIVDESQHLPIRTIEALRGWSDHFADQGLTLGIAFIGNTETATRFGGKKKAEFEQISNRTKQKRIYRTTQIQRGDIVMLFPLLEGKDKEIDFLLAIARSPQALRGASNLFSNAYDNENITYEGLVAMAKHMEMRV